MHSVHLQRHDRLTVPYKLSYKELCSITLSNYKHDTYSVLLVLKLSGWWPVTFKNFVIVLIRIISWSNTKFFELMTRIVWEPVRRFTDDILGVNG